MGKLEQIEAQINTHQAELEQIYESAEALRKKISQLTDKRWKAQKDDFWKRHPGLVLKDGSRWVTVEGIELEVGGYWESEETGEAVVFVTCDPIPLEIARKLKPLTLKPESKS